MRFFHYSILDKELEKYLGNGTFQTISELKTARDQYLISDLFINRRRNIIAHPIEIDTPYPEDLRYVDEIELAVNELMKDVKKELGEMSKDSFEVFHLKFLEAAKVFPLPVDVYIPSTEACILFELTEIQLATCRELEFLSSIKQEGEHHYHWVELQALFY